MRYLRFLLAALVLPLLVLAACSGAGDSGAPQVSSGSTVTSDDPRVQVLLDALPSTDLALFGTAGDWEMHTQRNVPAYDRALRCGVGMQSALTAQASDGTPATSAAIEAAIGPSVTRSYRYDGAEPGGSLHVILTDLSAVTPYVHDPALVVIDALAAAPRCETWEPLPGVQVTTGAYGPETLFAPLGDGGRQWSVVSQYLAAGQTQLAFSAMVVFAVGDRLVAALGTGLVERQLPETLVDALAQAVAENLR